MLYEYFVNYFQLFLVIVVRIIGLFLSAPFFSGSAIPFRFKLAFAFFVSLLAAPLVVGMGVKPPTDLAEFGVRLVSSFIFGVGVGFFAAFVVTSFNVAAQAFSIQMGLGMNEVYDPVSDTQVPAVGNMLEIMILLLLLRADAQFYMVEIIVNSFKSVDIVTVQTAGMILKGLLSALVAMFDIGLKLSLPIIGVTVLLDVAMGLISRVAPQFNVMVMGFNIKILFGFIALWLILPPAADLGISVINFLLTNMSEWITFMKPTV